MKHTRILVVLFAAVAATPRADAKAPAGRYVVDAAAGTVYDTATKLTWQRAVPAMSYNWADAKTYCANPGLIGAGWHLPNLTQLASIVDYQQNNPAIDGTAFPATPYAGFVGFWSATPTSGSTSSAWAVYFNYGNQSSASVGTSSRVRCVR